MHDTDWLAERFEEQRPRLTGVARRMLGSASEADDAVQEAWLRLSRTDAEAIDNLGSWLTTVLARVCLNVLQSRRVRSEVPLDGDLSEPAADPAEAADPEQEALLAESVGLALLVVLDALSPAERVAFVLHDMFGVPFEEIAPIVGRNQAAARQLASRARRRVRREDASGEADRVRQAKLVEAFLAAARDGEFERLLGLLAPDVVLTADASAARIGVARELRGAEEVGGFCRYARGATPALLDGDAAVVWLRAGRPRVVYRFTARDGRIAAIELIADPERLAALDLVVLGG
ncbi:sigma-70 family RNA polymerase sigma factor [Conexibacter arvalis]|uniref:RNA polymerase sigma-70 factor (ECF subfamily) n=1 Tax=Conexibacter arvalis TaxID=912552 RepID=A0A840IDG4_9ACTN|nr:sigma-70 family RNA polymerase sigma factor [Conexibacter arvalis]MBB4662846.1 RNA polymerase sigma-70 factor (ECF subfamily) [Conexibacter arvalis]